MKLHYKKVKGARRYQSYFNDRPVYYMAMDPQEVWERRLLFGLIDLISIGLMALILWVVSMV